MVDFVYLRPTERPPPDTPWLLIIKTHDHDFELIVSHSIEVTTLGMDASLQEALDRASQAADTLRIATVYVMGTPIN